MQRQQKVGLMILKYQLSPGEKNSGFLFKWNQKSITKTIAAMAD